MAGKREGLRARLEALQARWQAHYDSGRVVLGADAVLLACLLELERALKPTAKRRGKRRD